MTLIAETRLSNSSVIGPYSPWPRRRVPHRRIALITGGAATAGLFLHCVAPMLIGA